MTFVMRSPHINVLLRSLRQVDNCVSCFCVFVYLFIHHDYLKQMYSKCILLLLMLPSVWGFDHEGKVSIANECSCWFTLHGTSVGIIIVQL